jgi:hypothetical protein
MIQMKVRVDKCDLWRLNGLSQCGGVFVSTTTASWPSLDISTAALLPPQPNRAGFCVSHAIRQAGRQGVGFNDLLCALDVF